KLLYKVNVEGTANVVNVCLANPGVKLCHVSSVSAIGKIQGELFPDENSRWEAQQGHSVYAATKHWGEAEVWRGIAEGLNAVIVNPSIVLGGSNAKRSSTRLLGYVAAGNLFYIDGQSNFVDLRDVTEAMRRLMFSEIKSERFILNAGLLDYEQFFTLAAQCLQKRPPQVKLPMFLARGMAKAEQFRSWLTGARPIITPDTVRRTKDRIEYKSDKVEKAAGIKFRPVEETILWACGQLKNNLRG
ncbi:MAG: NAD-dependent epimerase/dehydratase family protein, partial [Moraxellaceae bacterium]